MQFGELEAFVSIQIKYVQHIHVWCELNEFLLWRDKGVSFSIQDGVNPQMGDNKLI